MWIRDVAGLGTERDRLCFRAGSRALAVCKLQIFEWYVHGKAPNF